MSGTPRVLHIGGNRSDAAVIQEALITTPTAACCAVEWLATLPEGLARLKTSLMSAVVFDLQHANGSGVEGVKQLVAAVPATPVLAIAGRGTEHLVPQAIQAGAFDCVLASHLDSYWLPRMLLQAIGRRESESALLRERERAQTTLNSLGDAILSTDLLGRICYMNEQAKLITEWSRADAMGQPLEEVLRVVDEASRERIMGPFERGIAGELFHTPASNCVVIGRNGSESFVEHSVAPVRDALGLVTGATIVLRDVSAARALSEKMLHLASHDPLTDLPNRSLLDERLERALTTVRRHSRRLAVLFLDIDRFKSINDRFGHLVGDEVLQAVSREAVMCVRSSDTVSRHGGDEFVVVLSELERAEDAATVAEKIHAALAAPRMFQGHEIQITVSIGISVFPNDGDDATRLLTRADMALYRVKGLGRNGYQFFHSEFNLGDLPNGRILRNSHRCRP